jgi:hypothetical protein
MPMGEADEPTYLIVASLTYLQLQLSVLDGFVIKVGEELY